MLRGSPRFSFFRTINGRKVVFVGGGRDSGDSTDSKCLYNQILVRLPFMSEGLLTRRTSTTIKDQKVLRVMSSFSFAS